LLTSFEGLRKQASTPKIPSLRIVSIKLGIPNDDYGVLRFIAVLSSVPMDGVMSMMRALVYSREDRPVVSPETRSAPHRLQEE
jgi:hypothetical protein